MLFSLGIEIYTVLVINKKDKVKVIIGAINVDLNLDFLERTKGEERRAKTSLKVIAFVLIGLLFFDYPVRELMRQVMLILFSPHTH